MLAADAAADAAAAGSFPGDGAPHLAVEHAYGYRGHDCRGNLAQLPGREAAYHCASLGILERPGDRRQVGPAAGPHAAPSAASSARLTARLNALGRRCLRGTAGR